MNDGWFVWGRGIVVVVEPVLNCKGDDGLAILKGIGLTSLNDYIEIIGPSSKEPRSSCQGR